MSNLKFENDNTPSTKSTQYVQLTVVVAALAIGAYLVFSYLIWPIIWWILAILGVFVLALNYKLVWRGVKWIIGLYKKNTWLGVAATVGGFLAFTPLMVFLFLKTIWDFRNSDFMPGNKDKKKLGIDAETIDFEEEKFPLPPSHQKNKDNLFQ